MTVSTSPDSKAIRNLPDLVEAVYRKAFQLPRIAKPSGTEGQVLVRAQYLSLFQLPRIAKPSGTQPLRLGTPSLRRQVSTSPDSKAIRNLRITGRKGAWLLVSTSPDSKAIRNQESGQRPLDPGGVSTSPDSKAIRNLALARFGRTRFSLVSTSPDSKAIRNLQRRTDQPAGSPGFNFPG